MKDGSQGASGLRRLTGIALSRPAPLAELVARWRPTPPELAFHLAFREGYAGRLKPELIDWLESNLHRIYPMESTEFWDLFDEAKLYYARRYCNRGVAGWHAYVRRLAANGQWRRGHENALDFLADPDPDHTFGPRPWRFRP